MKQVLFGVGMAAVGVLGSVMPCASDDHPIVVELFTSQGCPSCPPADALLHELASRDDIIALALHVDYWDYIGWKDKFASTAFTQRQKSYARAAGSRSIYTPQFIVGGVDHVVGYEPMQLASFVQNHRSLQSTVEVGLVRSGNQLEVTAQTDELRQMLVQLVRYTPLQTVAIEHGENSGKIVEYANVVHDWQVVGKWDGRVPLSLSVENAEDGPFVAIIQAATHGAILGAARLH
jgi:hypothetical protein